MAFEKDVTAKETNGTEAIETPATSPRTSDDGRDVEQAMQPVQKVESAVEDYPQGIKLALIMTSIYLAIFLQALDRTIISTALPRITDDFHSFGDVGWYNGAFLLTISAFQLILGRIYTFYSPKWVFVTSVVIFEIGSAICGAAPNSVAFIWGRAIAGLGASGTMNGGIVLMVYAVPLHKRPMYMGLVGAVFGIASVAGPLLGGVFTTKVTWRWCFYINLPIGGVVIAFLTLFLDVPAFVPVEGDWKAKLARLDFAGTLVFIPCIVCLLLALEWGGSTKAWNSGTIIALLVLFGVLAIVFVCVQIWKGDSATVPPRIIKQRSIAAGTWFSFAVGASFMSGVYYIPVWFQAIKGDSAVKSGVSTIPLLLGLVFLSILTGITVSKVGYYAPVMIASSVLLPIAGGLLSTFTPTTGHSKWIGVEFFFGAAIGFGMQQASVAAQTVLPRADVPTGTALVWFAQSLGGTVSVSISQNILNNHLIKGLSHLPGFSPTKIVDTGATNLRIVFPPQYLQEVLQVYQSGLSQVFYVVAAFACFSIFGSAAMEWRNVKDKKRQQDAAMKKKLEDEEKRRSEIEEAKEESQPEAEPSTEKSEANP